MKYKVGDKVRVKKFEDVVYSDNTVCGISKQNWIKLYNKELIIGRIDSCSYYLRGGDGWTFPENSFELLSDSFQEGEEVYVSDISVEDALKQEVKRIFICKIPGNVRHSFICTYPVCKRGENYDWDAFSYIAKIPKETERKIVCSDEKWEKIQNILDLK